MIKFPYGMSDFRQIITEGYYYADRTGAIPDLERAKTQLFIRPRRFGKSLLLSMLENYYDIARRDQFETIFGNLTIGQDPTPLRNSYFILRWDFSCVDPTGTAADVKRSLHNHINACIADFAQTYRCNGFDLKEIKIDRTDALFSMKSMISAAKTAGHPIYLLIDEYDNFANTVMMLPASDSRERYNALVHDEGLLRTLMKTVKSLTGGDMFDRVFITGVSPVVMSDITSGHNIAEDIFFEPEFGALCGFQETEIDLTLHEISAACRLGSDKRAEALAMMRTWYNGYNFVPRRMDVVYNPTLCLHFFKQFLKNCAYPRKMLDANLAVDESKLDYVGNLPGGGDLLLSLVQKAGQVRITDMADRFGLSEMLGASFKDRTFLASFLYYFGVLTLVGETEQGELALAVPNLVTQSLYVNRVQHMMLPDPVSRDRGLDAAKKVYQYGNIAPICAFIQNEYFPVFKNRDCAQANELTLKTCFLTLLYNDILYIMDSEPEIDRRYADLTMIIRPDRRHLKIHDVLIEFKFLSLRALNLSGAQIASMSDDALRSLPRVVEALAKGRQQVTDYGETLARKYRDLRLKRFVVAALGFEKICWLDPDNP